MLVHWPAILGLAAELREDDRYRWQAGGQTVQYKLILSFGLCLGQGGGAVLSKMWAAVTGSYIPSCEGNHKEDCYALVCRTSDNEIHFDRLGRLQPHQ